jgi:DNA-binding SARP family transcriptional activator
MLGSRELVVPLRKARAVLGYLASYPGQPHTRAKLATLLWGESSETDAFNSLRQTVFVIRKATSTSGPSVLVADGETLSLSASGAITDVAEFERLAVNTWPAALERAVSLYTGEFLAGLDCDDTPFQDWLLGERRRLLEMALQALDRLVSLHTREGNTDRATDAAVRLLSLDPLREAAHRSLMQLLTSSGRWGAALRQYQLCVDVLRRELDVDPEPETQALYREVLRRRPASGSTPRSGDSGGEPAAAPFVGRRAELETLIDEVTAAIAGRGRNVLVAGAAGIGKTRLLEMLIAGATRAGCAVLRAKAYETEQVLPFGLWIDALRSRPETAGPQMADGLAPDWRRELARLLPELGVSPAPRGSGGARRLFEAVARLLAHLGARQPLLVILDDLQWADDMSVRLLAFLGRRVQPSSLCVVGAARSEAMPRAPLLESTIAELQQHDRLRELPLGPLSPTEIAELAGAMARRVAGDTAGDVVAERVWAVSAGNPLVAVETVRAMHERRRRDAEGKPVPRRALQIIRMRLQALSDSPRDLVEVAAVIGRSFDFDLLVRASRRDAAVVASGMEELVRRRLVHEVAERFDFTHDVVREAALLGVSEPRRPLLHAAVAEALEALGPEALGGQRAALAGHCREARLWDRAVTHFRAAGAEAAARGAYREAIGFFEQALALLGHLPASAATMEHAIDLRLDLRDWLLALDDHRRIRTCLEEAEALARTLDDRRRLGRIWGDMAHYFREMGEPDQTVAYARRTWETAEALSDDGLRALARFYGGQGHHALGNYRQAVELFRGNVESLTGARMVERLAGPALVPLVSRVWMASALADIGEFTPALALLDETERVATDAEHPFSLMRALHMRGRILLLRGDVAHALDAAERCVALDAMWDIPLLRSDRTSLLGQARLRAGRHADGLALLEDAARTLVRPDAIVIARLAEGYLAVGRFDEAHASAERALEVAIRAKHRPIEAAVLLLAGEIQAAREDGAAAWRCVRGAIALAQSLEMGPLVALCHLEIGRLPSGRGHRTALRHLDTARKMFETMGMSPPAPRNRKPDPASA